VWLDRRLDALRCRSATRSEKPPDLSGGFSFTSRALSCGRLIPLATPQGGVVSRLLVVRHRVPINAGEKAVRPLTLHGCRQGVRVDGVLVGRVLQATRHGSRDRSRSRAHDARLAGATELDPRLDSLGEERQPLLHCDSRQPLCLGGRREIGNPRLGEERGDRRVVRYSPLLHRRSDRRLVVASGRRSGEATNTSLGRFRLDDEDATITVRVAYAWGAAERRREELARHTGEALAMLLAGTFLVSFWALGPALAMAWAGDAPEAQPVVAQAVALLPYSGLALAALTLGATSTAILRGRAEVTVPAALTLSGYWLVGFTTILLATQVGGRGAEGVWIGLAAGSMAAAASSWGYRSWRERASNAAERKLAAAAAEA
jgi:hypothetical protein